MSADGRQLYEEGIAREKAGDLPAAFESFRQSAKADPSMAAPYVGLSRILLRNHQRAEAIVCLERAARCEPANATVHGLLGQASAQHGELEKARRSFEQARRLNPGEIGAAIGLAVALEDIGERTEAAGVYRDLLARAPGDGEAIAGLLGLSEGGALEDVIALARQAMQRAPDRDAALIGYALGKALAREGDHEGAFAAWAEGNSARRRLAGPFDPEKLDARIQRMIDIFSADFFAARRNWGSKSERPVFVVGLPRSGTTLTEQILAAHPSVHGAGELDLLTDMATGTPGRLGRTDPPWPETAPDLTRDHVSAIADEHLARLATFAPESALRVIDKQPLNFWHLGLVALIFPNARILHCQRDLRDNGLSIFAENFTPEQRWSTELAGIAHYARGYRRLMQHWRAVTGLQILDVSYEETVGDVEAQARRMLAFLDLLWDGAVLAFHETKRAVQTPSRWQVRKPLYASSAGRWRAYERHLGPLLQAADAPA